MMRIAAVALATSLSAVMAKAQDQTLLSGNATYGGFGGPVVKLARIAGRDAVMVGGRGGLIVNGTFIIGGGGTGWRTESIRGSDGAAYQLDVGYGGVDLEYIHRTHQLVHFAVQLSLGGGRATQGPAGGGPSRHVSFLIAEPGLHLELNVTKGFRVGAGVSYRFVSGLELPAFSNADLRGAAATLTFKLGKFSESARTTPTEPQ